MLVPQFYVLGCLIHFWVILGYFWAEIVFLKGMVKLEEMCSKNNFQSFVPSFKPFKTSFNFMCTPALS